MTKKKASIQSIKTIHNDKGSKKSDYLKDYKYQKKLTAKLDKLKDDFDQDVINEIVLWKVDRYAELKEETFILLNDIKPTAKKMDRKKTGEILKQLLSTRGIRLAAASTILRFRNPHIYQIIDQRAYRVIYGHALKSSLNHDKQISLYFDYLDELKKLKTKFSVRFQDLDRILYQADKKLNKGVSISNIVKTKSS